MLPLRPSQSVERFPVQSVVVISVFVLAHLLAYVLPESNRSVFLEQSSLSALSSHPIESFLLSIFYHESVFALWMSSLYLWCFTPRLFEKRNIFLVLSLSLTATALSSYLYLGYHGPKAVAPLLLAQTFVSALLGVAMRSEIWGMVTTLVFGPKLFQVFEVPSYVLLFFWVFYMMLGNLFMAPVFAEAPTIYFLPLVAFIAAFLLETFALWIQSKISKKL